MMPQELPRYSWKSSSPLVVLALKFLDCKPFSGQQYDAPYGAVEPNRKAMLEIFVLWSESFQVLV